MFVILLTAFFGIVGSSIAGAIIQHKGTYERSIGFPSMIGGLLAAAGICLLVAAAPFTWAWMPLVASAVSLGFGVGGTYIARPLVEDYVILREKERERSGRTQ